MTGKLTSKQLNDYVLSLLGSRRKEVVVSANVGEDCALLDMSGKMLVTSDPITGATKNIGKLAIEVASNDIYASGGEAIAAFLTIIVPEHTPLEDIKNIVIDAEDAAEKLNIQISGGHTEFSDSVVRPIVSCCIVGSAMSNKIFSAKNISVGDSVLMTGSAAREYTAIMLADNIETIGLLNQKEIDEVKDFINVSIAKEAKICTFLPVSCMHDATEGGIYGAIDELLLRSELSCKLQTKSIPIAVATKKICKYYDVDPLKQLASGSLIVITKMPKEVIKELKRHNIEAVKIGDITAKGGLQLV